eukprot:4636913-Amphidinium_carterae.1
MDEQDYCLKEMVALAEALPSASASTGTSFLPLATLDRSAAESESNTHRPRFLEVDTENKDSFL